MNTVILATSKNFLYREALRKGGYEVTEYPLPVSQDMIRSIARGAPCAASITEALDGSVENRRDLYRALREKGQLLCIGGVMNDDLKAFLLDHGVSDVLLAYNERHFVPYLKIITEEQPGDAGTFIVIDDDGADREVARKIIGRFRYRTVFVNTVDELFGSALNSEVRFILVNLGAKNLDLNGLVRKFYSSKMAHTIPVLAYKDMREGLFVHELVGGLNRLTRFILSREELFSLLVDILFKKEILPLVASLRKLVDFDANSFYDTETLGQAFFKCEKNIFNQKNLHDGDTLASMMKAVAGMNRAILKAEGLRWLRMDTVRRDINTAEREV